MVKSKNESSGGNTEYIYTGIFLKKEDVLTAANRFRGDHLANLVEEPHVTLAFRPTEVNPALFGTPVDVIVIGYGNDGENEGLKVRIRTTAAELQKMAEKLSVPHITVSLADGAKAIDTAKIKFHETEKTDEAIVLHGVYGAFNHGGSVSIRL